MHIPHFRPVAVEIVGETLLSHRAHSIVAIVRH